MQAGETRKNVEMEIVEQETPKQDVAESSANGNGTVLGGLF